MADGVGGWQNVKGADAALYSRQLMHFASCELNKFDYPDLYDVDENEANAVAELQKSYTDTCPREILKASYEKVKINETKEGLVGSSTALIVVLRVNFNFFRFD